MNLLLMRLIDEQYTRTPFYGSRKIAISMDGRERRMDNILVERL